MQRRRRGPPFPLAYGGVATVALIADGAMLAAIVPWLTRPKSQAPAAALSFAGPSTHVRVSF